MNPRDHIHVKCVSVRDLKLTYSGEAISDDKVFDKRCSTIRSFTVVHIFKNEPIFWF